MNLNLTSATPRQLGAALDRAGIAWSYDEDGDLRVRFRSGEHPWKDVVFYEFDSTRGDFSMRGQFLNGRPVPEGNGMTRWEVSLDGGHRPTAVAQKVLTVYLMPGVGGVGVQIHAAVAPLDQRRPMHIKIIPGSDQVGRIESEFPGFTGAAETRNGGSQFWMSGRISGTNVDDADLIDIIRMTFRVGLQMFDGPFTGWFYATDF